VAVLASGVRRVVVAHADPFPQVAGGGLRALTHAGLSVEVGCCAMEAAALLAPYLKLQHTGTPWVIAKWAMTLDGKIATHSGESKWISSEASRHRVQELRGRVDAVLVGAGTVRADDPLLTARVGGPRLPARVVVCGSGNLPADCQLTRTAMAHPVLVYTAAPERLLAWQTAGAEVIAVRSIRGVLRDLGQRRFTNVLVEGGAGLLGSLFDAQAVDELEVYIAPMIVGGAAAPGPVAGQGVAMLNDALRFENMHYHSIGTDVLLRARRATG